MEWAWRIPFVLSLVLVIVGVIVRLKVAESPVFEEIRERAEESSAPLGVLLRNHFPLVFKAALIFAANNAFGYMVIAFFGSYAAKQLGMNQTHIFLAVILAAIAWTALTLWSGSLSDRIGRRQAFMIGYALLFVLAIPVWFLIDTANIFWFGVALLALIPGLALSYGPQSAMYAELFPRSIRFSGVSVGYALGSILGGAFAPMIAQLILGKTGATWTIGIYLMVLCVLSMIALAMTPKDLHRREL